jgi:uncharacterized protein
MSQENVEIVRRAFEAYERGDLPALLGEFSSDVVIRQTAPVPDARTYHGQEGLLKVISDWTEVFDAFVMTAKDFVDAGNDKVIVRVHQKPRGTESGAAGEGDFWFVYTVGGGKLVRLDMFNSKSEALEATGLRE